MEVEVSKMKIEVTKEAVDALVGMFGVDGAIKEVQEMVNALIYDAMHEKYDDTGA